MKKSFLKKIEQHRNFPVYKTFDGLSKSTTDCKDLLSTLGMRRRCRGGSNTTLNPFSGEPVAVFQKMLGDDIRNRIGLSNRLGTDPGDRTLNQILEIRAPLVETT